jgi:hypothetical protein
MVTLGAYSSTPLPNQFTNAVGNDVINLLIGFGITFDFAVALSAVALQSFKS